MRYSLEGMGKRNLKNREGFPFLEKGRRGEGELKCDGLSSKTAWQQHLLLRQKWALLALHYAHIKITIGRSIKNKFIK